MPTKVFTTLGGNCPFGKGVEIDSLKCRNCEYYWRIGTGTFFWCLSPAEPQPAPPVFTKRKPGRPKGSKNKKKGTRRKIKPVEADKDKKR